MNEKSHKLVLPFWINRFLTVIPPLLLTLITFAWYYPSLRYDFQFDDLSNIRNNFAIRHLTFWDLFFLRKRWVIEWLNTVHYKYGTFDPYQYRLWNNIFHCLTGLLVFFLLYTLLGRARKDTFFAHNRTPIAYLVCLFFLLHPVQTQTVSYVIQGQLEGLATLSIIGVVLLFVLCATASTRIMRLLLTVLLFALAFISTGTKEIAIVSPLLALVADWFFVAQGDWQNLKDRLPLHAALFAVVWGSYCYLLKPSFFIDLLGLKMQMRNNIGNVLTDEFKQAITPYSFCISQFKVILHYLAMFIWPFNISVEYDWKLSKGFFAPDAFFPFLVLCLIAFYVVTLLRRDRTHVAAFAGLWFFIMIAPRSSIIPSSELLVDYKTYGASIGVFLLMATGCVYLIQLLSDHVERNYQIRTIAIQYVLILLLAVPNGYATYRRNLVWESGQAFWGNIVAMAPGKPRAHNNYAVALSATGEHKEAIIHLKRAISMDRFYPDPRNNLAIAYSRVGQVDNAIDTIKQLLAMCPNYIEAHNNLATLYMQKGQLDQAERLLERAIALRPHYGKAFHNLARIADTRKDISKKLYYVRKACLEADLDNETGFFTYAQTAVQAQQFQEAVTAFKKLHSFQPESVEYTLGLAQAYQMNGQTQKALQLFEQLAQRFPHKIEALKGLAQCYHTLGKPDMAANVMAHITPPTGPVAS